MAVFFDLDALPPFTNAVVTVGTFDGVHLGHQLILSKVVQEARNRNGESILVTFDPHPRQLLFPTQPLGIITPLNEKAELVHSTGIDHIVVVPFTQAFAALTAEEYVQQFIWARLRPACIVIGYDHKFGHDRAGDIQLLRDYSGTLGFEIVEIPPRLIEEAAISSTRVRNAVLTGEVAEASKMLGRAYSCCGIVVHGKQLGRTIGYPTANILPLHKEQIIPGVGIYAVLITVEGSEYMGMMSIGYNPTVSSDCTIKMEVHIFDFSHDIYGASISISFVDKIRDEVKFEGLDQLKEQLHRDAVATHAILHR
jgi:riboflavin kinase / FMN adenylyltransferase